MNSCRGHADPLDRPGQVDVAQEGPLERVVEHHGVRRLGVVTTDPGEVPAALLSELAIPTLVRKPESTRVRNVADEHLEHERMPRILGIERDRRRPSGQFARRLVGAPARSRWIVLLLRGVPRNLLVANLHIVCSWRRAAIHVGMQGGRALVRDRRREVRAALFGRIRPTVGTDGAVQPNALDVGLWIRVRCRVSTDVLEPRLDGCEEPLPVA